jgi:DNA-binding transcriptional MerR regulator
MSSARDLRSQIKGSNSVTTSLPAIPNKLYFNISEAAKLCGVKSHVLRYWEEVLPQLRPQRRGNRRYYLKSDIMLVRRIRSLLYEQGYTLKGARHALSSGGALNVYKDEDETPLSREALREALSGIAKEMEQAVQHMQRYDRKTDK